MVSQLQLDDILFLDIETVPQFESFNDLDELDQQLYADKTKYQRKEEFTPEEFYDRAGIWAEFGKIVCISLGYFVHRKHREFRVRSFTGTETKILQDFAALLNEHFSGNKHVLCAHNGKEFDFPYIARRMIINELEIPSKLDLFGKKPWEVMHLDTMELWKFGDYKHFTSLKLLTRVLGIESPKDDIDGSQVRDVFYKEKDIERIARYCERDVVAVAQVILRLRKEPLLRDEQVVSR